MSIRITKTTNVVLLAKVVKEPETVKKTDSNGKVRETLVMQVRPLDQDKPMPVWITPTIASNEKKMAEFKNGKRVLLEGAFTGLAAYGTHDLG